MVCQNQCGVGTMNRIEELERINDNYLQREKPLLKVSIIIPVLFVVSQFLELLIILPNRLIIPPEMRGFSILAIIVILILNNILNYFKFNESLKSESLTHRISAFNEYKKVIIRNYFAILVFTTLYFLLYFYGFLRLLLFHPPSDNLGPVYGRIMHILIIGTFLLQVFYLIYNSTHVRRWRRMEDRKKSEYERIATELEIELN